MSTGYSVHVFYGTFVDRKSAIGRRLDAYIDKHGGTPAPTGPPRPLIRGNTELMQHAIFQLLGLQSVPFEDVLKDLPPIGWYIAETTG